MRRVMEPLNQMGSEIRSESGGGVAPLRIHGGKLRGIDYKMPIASAQVKSSILLAGLQASGVTMVRNPRVTERCPFRWRTRSSAHSTRPCQRRSILHRPWCQFLLDDQRQVLPGDAGIGILEMQARRDLFVL